jgi:hypothetical protein
MQRHFGTPARRHSRPAQPLHSSTGVRDRFCRPNSPAVDKCGHSGRSGSRYRSLHGFGFAPLLFLSHGERPHRPHAGAAGTPSLIHHDPPFSPAKINLWLRVLGKRSDGFHEVQTRLCRLALGDTVELEHLGKGTQVSLTCSDPTVPLDESNLAMRALRAFENRTGKQSSWRIHLEKKIPAGAGLGGGSSNAATVLNGANQLAGSRCHWPS